MHSWRFLFGISTILGFLLAHGHAVELPKDLPPHPRLLFSQDELPGIKARAAGPCRQHFESLKSQAENWLRTKVKLPDRGGQWFHWYSCPKHGARLRTEGPSRHVCPVDQEVFSGYPYDDVAVSGEHNRLAAAIRTLGIVYQISGDSRFAQKATEILLAYAAKYESYPLHDIHGQPKVGGGKVGPQTLDESTWLITVVEGADCVWDTLTREQQEKVKNGLLLPASDIIRQHKMGIHNIQCWKNSAVGLTGLLLGDMGLVDEALNGPSGYDKQMAKGVTADGPWFEGAWGYHFYTLSAVLHLTEGAFHSGIDLYGPQLKQMFDAPLAMAMPNLRLPAFNDSTEVDLAGTAGHYVTAWARYKNPQYLLLISREPRGTDSALLHGVPADAQEPAFEPISRNFGASGNAILAAGTGPEATWLEMKYGPHGGGHGHPDKLNFVLYGQGEVIAPDPGTANYGVPIQAGWFRTTLAHNTLVVDEKSQKPAEGKCVAFAATNGFSAVSAEAGPIYEGVNFRRSIALLGTNLAVFIDQVDSASEHVYDFVYHNRGEFAGTPRGDPYKAPEQPGYAYLRDMKSSQSSSALQFQFAMGAGKAVRWASVGGQLTTFITGTGVGKHTEDRVPLIIARRQCKSTAFLWCVFAGASSGPLQLDAEEVTSADGTRPDQSLTAAVRVTSPLGTQVVVVNASGKPAVVQGQRVESKLALLTQDPTRKFRVSCTAR